MKRFLLAIVALDGWLHMFAGALLSIVLIGFLRQWISLPPLSILVVLIILVIGISRELWQSRKDKVGRGELSPHRWGEAVAWGLGAIIGVVLQIIYG